ncbi:hypothetical protein AUQ37_02665 [Candidatus Methanomethylophilus sp. 1R26]|uniref:hypothetical protein n=1 Tax=Candidatus Methanomethylophilus sp. 1R26 TaxID=1769296 RepID=UPI0007378962|nr:hypothetical protein [Candidatus Methanomethylophilus sp. 1R26]KUE73348.1 hypothetical protein AUQ37_02665 [Candidatus Methanomethylophilus sp. 1R26]
MLALAARALPALFAAVIIAAVAWETVHLLEWCAELCGRYADGSLAGYLRMHAYTYMSYVFGEEPFGWTAER